MGSQYTRLEMKKRAAARGARPIDTSRRAADEAVENQRRLREEFLARQRRAREAK